MSGRWLEDLTGHGKPERASIGSGEGKGTPANFDFLQEFLRRFLIGESRFPTSIFFNQIRLKVRRTS